MNFTSEIKMKSGALLPSNLPSVIDRYHRAAKVINLIPRGDVGVEYVLSTPLRVVRGD